MRFQSAFLSLLFATFASAQTYVVHNNCPSAIDLFIGQDSQGSLPRGARLIKTGLGTAAGFFYATNNGGGVVNGQLLAARAGFFFEVRNQLFSLSTNITNLTVSTFFSLFDYSQTTGITILSEIRTRTISTLVSASRQTSPRYVLESCGCLNDSR
jgi:hypothetical protein